MPFTKNVKIYVNCSLMLLFLGCDALTVFNKGMDAYKNKNYSVALKHYMQAANHGNAAAQNNLATMYQNGEGVTRNYPKAIFWYKKAAVQNNRQAQYNLGNIYRKGLGTQKKLKKASRLFLSAAKGGHALSQYNLQTSVK